MWLDWVDLFTSWSGGGSAPGSFILLLSYPNKYIYLLLLLLFYLASNSNLVEVL